MDIAIVLLKGLCIFHANISQGETISFGGGKKDTISIEDFVQNQISIKWKESGLMVNVQKPFMKDLETLPLDTIVVLSEEDQVALFATSLVSKPKVALTLPYSCKISVGRADDNDIVIKLPYVSNHHMIIKNESGHVRIEDCGSTNGIYLNGKNIDVAHIKSGDTISILSVKIHLINGDILLENVGTKATVKQIEDEFYSSVLKENSSDIRLSYKRSPRTREQLPQEDIMLAAVPNKGHKFEKGRGLYSSLIGSGAMMAASMAVSTISPALLAARAASLVTPIVGIASSKGNTKRQSKKNDEYENARRVKYGAYIDEQKAKIESIAKVQREVTNRENPTPAECISTIMELKRNLWERMVTDKDFLNVRIGMSYDNLCISVKSRTDLNGFQLEDDEIRELTEQIIEETRIVDNIPAKIDILHNNTIGVIGDRRKSINSIRNLLISLSALHCFTEVKIVGIFDESEREVWSPMRWLPHSWDDEKQVCTLAFNREETHILCEQMYEMIKVRLENGRQNSFNLPYYVFIIGTKALVENEPIMGILTANHDNIGVSSIFMFDTMYSLPYGCKYIVDMDEGPCMYPSGEMNNRVFFTEDSPTSNKVFDSFVRRMSAIELEGFATRGGVPESISFLEGYDVKTIEELNVWKRWTTSKPYRSLAAPIGKMAGDKIFYFDIHEKMHGPHGLVAGTTGSGKSELLQTWILSMAVNYSPYDIAFVIIDYKGGGMANQLEPLPHVVGKITNIDSDISRALLSLDSENKRREILFEKYGVNHINKYQELYHNGQVSEPLPHLIIVADEFAELKKEESGFIDSLIKMARVGRSLGVHLVLATQKPSGVVDDQIWSNSQFQICLKVQNATDSREMIKRPDAAGITQPGRAYINSGQLFELFQSFWSGASYSGKKDDDFVKDCQVKIVGPLGNREKVISRKNESKDSKDELTSIISYISDLAEQNGIKKLQGPWLPELPSILSLNDVIESLPVDALWAKPKEWLSIPVGIFDIPQKQLQGKQYIDFARDGHLAIYGISGSGKTTLLKTIVTSLCREFAPNDVNIYILDLSGWSLNIFESMPHVGSVALDGEDDKYEKFGKMIEKEMDERKRIFMKHAVSSLALYREGVSQDLPAIFIIIDNIVHLGELYPNLEPILINVAAHGTTYGIYLVYTSNGTTGVSYKIHQNTKNSIAFELKDKGDYPSMVGRIANGKLPNVPGRALIKGNPPTLFHTAMYESGTSEKERITNLNCLIKKLSEKWDGNEVKAIPVMADTVSIDELSDAYHVFERIPVGVDYDDIETAYIDVSENYCVMVAGNTHKDTSRILAMLWGLMKSKNHDCKICLIDCSEEFLSEYRGIEDSYIIASKEQSVIEEITQYVNYLKKRNEERSLSEKNGDDYICAEFPIVFVLSDIKRIVDAIDEKPYNVLTQVCKIAKKLNVIVLAGGEVEEIAKYNQIEKLTQAIIAQQNGIVAGSTAYDCNFFRQSLSIEERKVELSNEKAMLFSDGKTKKIKLPKAEH